MVGKKLSLIHILLYFSYPVSWLATAAVHFLCVVILTRRLIRKSREQAAPPAPAAT